VGARATRPHPARKLRALPGCALRYAAVAAKPSEGTVSRKGVRCICCGTAVPLDHVRSEGRADRMGAQMMAIVAEAKRGRIYLPASEEHEQIAASARPAWAPETELVYNPRYLTPPNYGFDAFAKLFTQRQLVALTTFSDLVGEAREQVMRDAGAGSTTVPVAFGDRDGRAPGYADAVATYLGIAASKSADSNSTICTWMSGIKYEVVRTTFSRQALSMNWDYAESSPFAESSGDYFEQIGRLVKVFEIGIPHNLTCPGMVFRNTAKLALSPAQ